MWFRVKPLTTFCGFCTLLFGVEFLALFNLISSIVVIAVVSSVHELRLAGVNVSAEVQTLNAAWALLGIPIVVAAGVGALYRIETHLRLYFYYLVISFVMGMLMLIVFLTSSNVCHAAIPDEVKQMGESFVCGLTNSFVYFWIFVGGLVNVYFTYVVWSAAEEIHRSNYPELLSYKEKLDNQGRMPPAESSGKRPIAQGMPVVSGMPIANQSVTGMPLASGIPAVPF